jgi:hypothetical protein
MRLDKEVEVKQDDILRLVCRYNTSQRREFTFVRGWSKRRQGNVSSLSLCLPLTSNEALQKQT